jgi:1-aminocyclopropane-1-carboxylate deaminase
LELIESLKKKFGIFYLLPEGGTNLLALKGCAEIIDEIDIDYDIICVPVGTGGTLAGIITGLKGRNRAIGYSALKGNFLKEEIEKLISLNQSEYINWEVCTDYHFGGYAKFDMPLIDFINRFRRTTGIALDPVYTGKMMYGIYKMIKEGKFRESKNILAIHTGGLQGIAGFNQRFGDLIEVD